MNEKQKPDGGGAQSKDKIKRRIRFIRRWRIVLSIIGGLLVFGGLIYASLYFKESGDRAKFLTENILSVSVLTAIAVQACIYGRQREIMRRQWIAMRRSLRHSRKSAEIAEQALIAGQRAFVSVNIYNQNAIQDGDTKKISRYVFRPSWMNSGETPTRNMINHVSLQLFDGAMPMNWRFPDQWDNSMPEDGKFVPVGIAPKGTINGLGVFISVENLDAIIDGSKQAIMWGWAEYNDVFPNTPRHISRFAVRIGVSGNPRNIAEVFFEYVFLPTYNCSDEECNAQGYPAGRRQPN